MATQYTIPKLPLEIDLETKTILKQLSLSEGVGKLDFIYSKRN